MKITQLILDAGGGNVVLPQTSNERYYAELVPSSVGVEMVTTRMVRELRGSVWHIAYSYGYLETVIKDAALTACEKGQRMPITCAFLPPTGDDGILLYKSFFVTAITYPKFHFTKAVYRDGVYVPKPFWSGFAVELREVKPS